MTILVLIKHKDSYILASDGKGVCYNLEVNAGISKIHKHRDYVIGMTGNCTGLVQVKAALDKTIIDNADSIKDSLDTSLYMSVKELEKEFGNNTRGDFLIMKTDFDNRVSEALVMFCSEDGIEIENLKELNQRVTVLGSGSECFTASYKTLEKLAGADWNSRTNAEVISDIIYAMEVTAELDIYCNDKIVVKTFKSY